MSILSDVKKGIGLDANYDAFDTDIIMHTNTVLRIVNQLGIGKLGYVISIHKSQGSEFELVIIPICEGYKRMLYRKLIYTGITRAKKASILVSKKTPVKGITLDNI